MALKKSSSENQTQVYRFKDKCFDHLHLSYLSGVVLKVNSFAICNHCVVAKLTRETKAARIYPPPSQSLPLVALCPPQRRAGWDGQACPCGCRVISEVCLPSHIEDQNPHAISPPSARDPGCRYWWICTLLLIGYKKKCPGISKCLIRSLESVLALRLVCSSIAQ